MWLRRLLTWLEQFEDCFGRQSQRGALRRYVSGVLNDSRRKSMEAMWARLSDPGTYQAFQHFITHAPWDAERDLEAASRRGARTARGADSRRHELPEARARRRSASYVNTVGRLARWRIARWRSRLRCGRAHVRGCWERSCICRRTWLTPAQRTRPVFLRRCASNRSGTSPSTLLRQVRARNSTSPRWLGDAEFGDSATLRRTLHRAQLPYALGVSADLKSVARHASAAAAHLAAYRTSPDSQGRLPDDTQPVEARPGRRPNRLASGDSSPGATARIRRGAPASVRSA